MIRFISGGVTSNRKELFVESIENAAKNGRNVIVIIPDQFSFEYDKMLYNRLGAVKFNRITTAGFNRLAELLENKYGGCSGTGTAGENAKLILMYKAVKSLRAKNQICFYTKLADKKGLEKGNFISQLIKLIEQMRESGITSEIAAAAALNLSGNLGQKMTDISRIYAEYMLCLEQAGLHDSVSSISAAVRSARENGYFKGADVFIDAFSSFTHDEMKMIELCFAQADNVTVSLVIDADAVKHSIHPFRMPEMTFGMLKSMAENKGYEVVKTTESAEYKADIAYLSKNLLNVSKTPYTDKSENVRVFNADDVYSEASFVCAEMKHLAQQGYKYSDMAVILRNLSDDSSVFESTLERYDIPYFIDQADRISASSIVHYFTAIFNCITSKHYKTENILKLVKSPFFSPNKHNANNLEQYCLKWNIDGDMWQKEYFGLDISTVKQESMLKHIKSIEVLRKRIIDPFEKIKAKCGSKDIPANELCEAFFVLLDEMKVSQRTYSVVRTASLSGNDTQIELSRGLRQLWNSILSAVKSIYDILENGSISLRQFYELFRVMVSQMAVSNPPQKMDCIRIADASHSRLSNVKIAFICQVNDGVFPKAVSNNSLLSRVDMSQLQNALKGIDGDFSMFSGDVRNTLMREELSCYNAVSLATDKLYLTYINADLTGEEKMPSSLITDVLKTFKNKQDEKISELSLEFFCTSAKAAFHTAVEHFRDTDPSVAAIKMSLNNTEYASKLTRLSSGSDKLFESLKSNPDSDICTQSFFKDGTAVISASQIDTYYKCPFGYFCKYGLKLQPIEVMDMSSRHKGTLVHRALEIIFSHKDDSCELFLLTDDESTDELIRKLISDCFDEYYEQTLNSDFGKSKVFEYEYKLLKDITYTIVKYVQGELRSSAYTPISTEYSFGGENSGRVIKFETDNGRMLSVTGSIDRIDTADANGSKYVRIIDYKTGKITLDDNNLASGLNLQMLVYLDAYLKSENIEDTVIPAGIEYMSFGGKIKPFRDDSMPETEYKKAENDSILAAFKPKAMVPDEKAIIATYSNGTDSSSAYSPFDSKSKSKKSSEEFAATIKYAQNKVVEFGNALENGQFPMKAVKDVCKYCDYRTVCAKEKYDESSDDAQSRIDNFKAQIEKIIEESKGGES